MRLPSMVGMALLSGVGLSACAHTMGSGAQTADEADTELREHHRHHHRGGVTQFMAMSLDTLGASDAERPQVERLQSDLSACLAHTREIERKVVLASADGVEAGAISSAKLDEAIAELNATSNAVYECSIDALNQLHALLSPQEREVLADKLQAHWEVWREVNEEAIAGNKEKGGRLADLAEELDLTADQVDHISAALSTEFARSEKWEAKKAAASVQAFALAFVLKSFDARTVTPDASGQFTAQGARQMALFYETVTPFLKAEQRATLADLLREHANHPFTLSAK